MCVKMPRDCVRVNVACQLNATEVRQNHWVVSVPLKCVRGTAVCQLASEPVGCVNVTLECVCQMSQEYVRASGVRQSGTGVCASDVSGVRQNQWSVSKWNWSVCVRCLRSTSEPVGCVKVELGCVCQMS